MYMYIYIYIYIYTKTITWCSLMIYCKITISEIAHSFTSDDRNVFVSGTVCLLDEKKLKQRFL